MAKRRIQVVRIKEIIRCRLVSGLSDRQTAQAAGVSRTAVAKYFRAFKASGLEYAQLETMTDSALKEQLEGIKPLVQSSRSLALTERFPSMAVELKK